MKCSIQYILFVFVAVFLGCIKEVNVDSNFSKKLVITLRASSNDKYNTFYASGNFVLTEVIGGEPNLKNYYLQDLDFLLVDSKGNSTLVPTSNYLGYINDSSVFPFREGESYHVKVSAKDGRVAEGDLIFPKATKIDFCGFDTSASTYSTGLGIVKRDIDLSVKFNGSSFYNSVGARVYHSLHYITPSNTKKTESLISSFDFEDKPKQYFQPVELNNKITIAHYNDSIVSFQIDIDSIVYYLHTEDDAYIHYLKTIQKQLASSGDPFAEPTLIYSNVRGGLGIISGYSTSEKKIKFK
ncbi:MAG: DUF4249 family protein [Flavobacteriales bacterium]